MHSWLLGPVKLAILGLMNFGPFKKTGKKKATIQAFFDALSWEGFEQIVRGRRLCNWSGSFVGRDYLTVLQMAPFLLRYFLFEDSTNNVPTTDSSIILRLFTVLAEITIMVYMTRIDKPDEWAIRFNMLAGELVSLFEKWNLIGLEPKVNIAAKPKFHLLSHVSWYINCFGSPRNCHTETEESKNGEVRSQLFLTNRKSPSKDIAQHTAIAESLTFLVLGGVWVDKRTRSLTKAGKMVRELVQKEPIAALLGLESSKTYKISLEKKLKSDVSIHTFRSDRVLLDLYKKDILSVDIYQKGYLGDGKPIVTQQSFFITTSSMIYKCHAIIRESNSTSDLAWWVLGEAFVRQGVDRVTGCVIIKPRVAG